MRAVVAFLLLGSAAWAEAPDSSLRPVLRPGSVVETTPAAATVAQKQAAPRRNLASLVQGVRPPKPGRVIVGASPGIVLRSLRPEERPENLRRRATVRRAGYAPQPVAARSGTVCRDPAIRGARVAPIPGRIRGCGVADPVRVTSVAGVTLSTPAVMDCPTAKALNTWVEKGVKPAVGRLGGGVAGLKVAAHYACRTRNNRPGGKISEHGKGRAIDISAIFLANGVSITVLKGWRDRQHGPILRRMHAAACGPFGTVLGPDGDRYHQDHFHFDTARYRSGSYCR